MLSTVVATYVTDSEWRKLCAEPLERSFKRFHPDIPFVILEGDDVNNVFNSDPTQNIRFLKPFLGKKLRDQYERVILMDSDQMVVAPLTELFENEAEVAGVRSNDDNGVSLPMGAFHSPDIPWQEYLNCGLVSIAKYEAWDHWEKLNRGPGPHMNDAEQGHWNTLFHCGKYSKKLLDPVDSNIIYGTAANSHHWHKLYMEDGKVYLNLCGTPKHVKLLHRAGVGHIAHPSFQTASGYKFSADNFRRDVAKFVEEVAS